MSTAEEQIWNYIDGNCSPVEKFEIEQKLASDKSFTKLYNELLKINGMLLNDLPLDEPSMSFTRNLMKKINLEIAPIALKTKVNKAIIYVIAAFFGISIFIVLGYAISQSNSTFELPNLSIKLNFNQLANPIALRIFLMIDLVLGLVFLDSLLRSKKDKFV
ncbi:MAG: hypothetical protein EAZ15_06775 [Sphingobacteriales bacterium]|nr:MAG: hypothetical protein EAZ15_06775 [Sphingobacteriales bacterium]